MKEEKKERIPLWLYPSTIGAVDNLMKLDNCKSRSEFIESAVLFYSGYITSIEKSQFIPELFRSMFTGVVESSEDRISRLLFKLAVEQNILTHIIATSFQFSDDYLDKLRGTAIDETKQSNGSVSLKEINRSYEKFEK